MFVCKGKTDNACCVGHVSLESYSLLWLVHKERRVAAATRVPTPTLVRTVAPLDSVAMFHSPYSSASRFSDSAADRLTPRNTSSAC